MSGETTRKLYKLLEKTFIEESYDDRVFQTANENGQVICPECHAHDGSICIFTQ